MDQDEIEAIVSIDNLILRNLKVTQGYYRLSEGMKDVIGAKNISWCTFATYASKTAGYSIRHELLPDDLERAFRSFYLYRRLARFLRRYLSSAEERQGELDPVRQILAQISLSISQGNIMVFKELAPPYSQMVSDFTRRDSGEAEEEKLARLLSHFKPGPTAEDGQDACIEAFTAYYQASQERDPDRQAELIFLGNILIGLHEQTRLQPVIEKAMYAPVDEVLGDPVRLITPLGKRISAWVHKAFLAISRRVFSTIATQLFMSIYLPTGELRLGRNVKSPTQGQEYPPELRTIESERVGAILGRSDLTLDTLRGSRAVNWSDLGDRMNFIVDFFRSYQQNEAMLSAPFTAEQMAAIDDDRVPEGKL